MPFNENELQAEAERLLKSLHKFEYNEADCRLLAETTLEIAALKKAEQAIILAHSYQTPDIVYGVADKVGDSYGLAKTASETDAKTIVFASVLFMAETAKILNPERQVLVPASAGCSLADSITVEDVRMLRKKHPQAGFVAYVNTSAAIKAEVDVCCTSSNALKIIEAMDKEEIVFLPDKLMGLNLQRQTSKKLILWDGVCVVHEEFAEKELKQVRREFPKAKIIVHPECDPTVVKNADFIGSTEQMLNFIQKDDAQEIMVVTECGLADRARHENPGKKIVGTCHLCPYMKTLRIKDILQVLKNPRPHQVITLEPEIIAKARRSLDRMFGLEQEK